MEGDWRTNAECKKADPELFFPVGETSPGDLDQIERAKAFCVRCLVVDQCLEYALDTNQAFGVWGGLGEDERRALKRRAHMNRRRALIARDNG
ncbi:WhiB family transcriptional regulator [Candidatus Saccharibacteria bacterium]|nr:WhiB family transcriptional regulator [Candidatus Saccharibacteria bacterium]